MSENIGILLHKLTKYQTLLGNAPSNKKNLYQQKIQEYSNKLNKMGVDNSNIQGMNVLFGGETPEEKLAKLRETLLANRAAAAARYTGLQSANTEASESAKQQARKLIADVNECRKSSKELTARNEELGQQIQKQEERLQALAKAVDEFAELINAAPTMDYGEQVPSGPVYNDVFVNMYIENIKSNSSPENIKDVVKDIKQTVVIGALSDDEKVSFMKETLTRELSSDVELANKVMAEFTDGKYTTLAAAPGSSSGTASRAASGLSSGTASRAASGLSSGTASRAASGSSSGMASRLGESPVKLLPVGSSTGNGAGSGSTSGKAASGRASGKGNPSVTDEDEDFTE